MAMNRWVVDGAGVFVCGGFYEPTPAAGQSVVTLPDETMPDIVKERYDATSPTKRRLATQAELQAGAATTLAQHAQQDIHAQAAIKAVLAYIVSVQLGRDLTTADIPTVQAAFTKATTYYKFIVNNGL